MALFIILNVLNSPSDKNGALASWIPSLVWVATFIFWAAFCISWVEVNEILHPLLELIWLLVYLLCSCWTFSNKRCMLDKHSLYIFSHQVFSRTFIVGR